MARFYHIDRTGRLKKGDVIELTRYDDIPEECLQHHVDSLFPEGVSAFGDWYFLNSKMKAMTKTEDGSIILNYSAIIDLLFEYVRRSNYSHRPSRFQSLFAFESQNEANNFRKNHCKSIGDLWEVECDDSQPFKADMNNLKLEGSLLMISYRASCYWEGRPCPYTSKTPVWELLLKPPIRVVKKIDSHRA
jgi:hypothetical protein